MARRISLALLALLFVGSGVLHFVRPEPYLAMMPPYLPAHAALVAISGVFEILGGLGVLVRRTRRFAGWGLIALLVAVFLANLHMALYPDDFASIPVWVLVLRLPMQAVLIAWVWWATRPADGNPAG